MKHLLTGTVIAAILTTGCGGSKNETSGKQISDSTAITASVNPVTTPFFYVQLKGTLAGQPLTMHLLKNGPNLFRGFYNYEKIGEPIDVWGSLDSSQHLVLYENTRSEEEITFNGTLDSIGTFQGTWRGKGTAYPFTLKPDFSDALRFDVYYNSDSAILKPGLKGSAQAQASSAVIWPAAGTDAQIAAFIRQIITGETKTNDPAELVRDNVQYFLKEYQANGKPADSIATPDDSDLKAATWNWSDESDIKVVWNKYPLLVIERYGYTYTGGAHGNGGSTYITLDLGKKKILRKEDVFKQGTEHPLEAVLAATFREKYGLAPADPLNNLLLVDTIPVTDNFYLTDKGVGFSYNAYEIGPYAMGQVSLFLPFDKIRQYMKEQ